MHISKLRQSRFLTRADVGPGVLATIKEIFQENVAGDDQPQDLKYCVSFNELEKPLVLNSTNAQIIAQITKSEETDTWPGHRIVLYDDPSISFGGKLVGGIRVRAPKGKAAAPAGSRPVFTPPPAATPPPPAQDDWLPTDADQPDF